MTRAQDELHMRRALALAERARGRTSPNPLVGAVIVDRRGRVVAEGFHARAGQDHGEVAALRKLGFRAPGMTLYVTLEPHNHHSRTPPCTERIIEAGIARVVVGMRDPNPKVSGRGLRRLRAAGVACQVGVLEDECRALNRAWLTFITQGRPYVILKAAVTLDGFLATANGDARWVTGPAARAAVHELRDRVDAILVGAGTVRADDPELTTRLPGRRKGHDPLRVVLDGALSTSPRARLFRTGSARPLIVGHAGAAPRRVRALEQAGAQVWLTPPGLGIVLASLARRDIVTVLVEGGGDVLGQLLRAGLYDEVRLFQAPKLLGGSDGVPLFRGPGVRRMADALTLRVEERRSVGDDMMWILRPDRGGRRRKN